MIRVSEHTIVTLHFALQTKDGREIDSTFEKQPASLQFGDGSLLPHFEACLVGLVKGERRTFEMPPEKAFGQHNPANLQTMKRHSFGADMVLKKGLVVSFADASNDEVFGVIDSIAGDDVVVDFNHPLAGMTLMFSVEIVDISAV